MMGMLSTGSLYRRKASTSLRPSRCPVRESARAAEFALAPQVSADIVGATQHLLTLRPGSAECQGAGKPGNIYCLGKYKDDGANDANSAASYVSL